MNQQLIDELKNMYNCAICQNFLCKPVTLMCQHTFCKNCITMHIKNDSFETTFPSCPLCSQKFYLVEMDNKNSIIESTFDVLKQYIMDENDLKNFDDENKKEEIRQSIENQVKNELTREFMNTNQFVLEHELPTFGEILREQETVNAVLIVAIISIAGATIYNIVWK